MSAVAAQVVLNSLPYLVMVAVGSLLLIDLSRKRVYVLPAMALLIGGSLLTVISIIGTYVRFMVMSAASVDVIKPLLKYYFTVTLSSRIIESAIVVAIGIGIIRIVKLLIAQKVLCNIPESVLSKMKPAKMNVLIPKGNDS